MTNHPYRSKVAKILAALEKLETEKFAAYCRDKTNLARRAAWISASQSYTAAAFVARVTR